ncbi:DNA-binding protein [Sulfurimonas sp.]|jgi:predicted DNA-binding transcriptional regulator AlpA|uniref:helix-turn-helix transcriptional regulator n=1 Tax=Sulfurimonas sp. TaxID=2022749 RepID=UPI0025D6DCE3|nr:DNA-binding protein [Sulfurimonas sp.]MBT5934976.1 DNA-binding protein [Sulfurimonas sp.]
MCETVKREIEKKYDVSKRYYRANEVAIYLGIGLSTVWLYAKQGKLTAKKLSANVTVFNIDEIDALFNSIKVA